MSAKEEEALRRRFTAMIRNREKITGDLALRAAELELGQCYRSCNGEIALAPYGYPIPTGPNKEQALTPWVTT